MHLPRGERACPHLVSLHSYVKAGNLNIDRFISAELLRDLVEKNYECEKHSMPRVSSLCPQQ